MSRMNQDKNSLPVLLARFFLGAVFLYAGGPKILDPMNFAEAISNYRLVPATLVTLTAVAVPWLEVVVGICLLSGLLTRSAAALAGCLSFTFATAITTAVVRGLDIECGCFSNGARANWEHVLLNLFCLVLSVWLAGRGGQGWSLDGLWGIEDTALEG